MKPPVEDESVVRKTDRCAKRDEAREKERHWELQQATSAEHYRTVMISSVVTSQMLNRTGNKAVTSVFMSWLVDSPPPPWD